MLLTASDDNTVGVVVAKLQVASLHLGHLHLISHVREKHKKVLIFIGYYPGVRTKKYQLTVEERIAMAEETFRGQGFVICPLMDNPISNEIWSKKMDTLIEQKFPGHRAVLYGSRDSFIPFYAGKFPTVEVAPLYSDSGTQWRADTEFPHSVDARRAIIWDQEHRPPFPYATADIAIVDRRNKKVLLIGKEIHEGYLSFVGGHVEKSDIFVSTTAKREAEEEVPGVRFGELEYVNSVIIDDPRYRGTQDCVTTTFFVADYLGGVPVLSAADDEIDSFRWVDLGDLMNALVPWHRPLGELLLRKLGVMPAS